MDPASLHMPHPHAPLEGALESLATTTVLAGEYSHVLSILFRIWETTVIFGCVPPFAAQYIKLRRSGNLEGFSLYVCLIVISANILRIFFWTVKRFDTPLLVQSFVVISTMLFVFRAYVAAKRLVLRLLPEQSSNSFMAVFVWKRFWAWTNFASYLYCILLFVMALGLITAIFSQYRWYGEFLGSVAMLLEAMSITPQFIRNFRIGSTAGVSSLMMLMIAFGDAAKLCYCLLRGVPIQFTMCAVLQVAFDFGILGQIAYYLSFGKNKTRTINHTPPIFAY